MADARAIAVSDRRVVVAGAAGRVRVLRTRSLHAEVWLPLPHHSQHQSHRIPDAVSVAVLPHENSVLVSYSDSSVYCWSVEHKDSVTAMWAHVPHLECIWSLASHDCSGNSSLLATASQDGAVRMWRCTQPSQASCGLSQPDEPGDIHCGAVVTHAGHLGSPRKYAHEIRVPRTLAFSPCGTRLAVGDTAGTVSIYDSSSLRLIKRRPSHDGVVRQLAFSDSAEQPLLASGGEDGFVHIVDASTAKDSYIMCQTVNEHEGMGVTALAFFKQGRCMFTAAQDSKLVVRCAPRA